MSNFSALKTAIQNAIKQNGNEEITGALLQGILLSIVETLGDTAINALETGLSSEATTRGNADTTLQTNINNEATARQNADSQLQTNINNEATARQNADTQLNNLITGIKNNIDNGYVYAGIATPSTTPVSGKVFYVAVHAGTYTNFGSIAVTQGINILKYNGSVWSKDVVIGIDDEPTAGSENLLKSGGVCKSIEELSRNVSLRPQKLLPLLQWYDKTVDNHMKRIDTSQKNRVSSDFFIVDPSKKLTISVGNPDYTLNIIGYYGGGGTMKVIANSIQSYDNYFPDSIPICYFCIVVRKANNSALTAAEVASNANITLDSMPQVAGADITRELNVEVGTVVLSQYSETRLTSLRYIKDNGDLQFFAKLWLSDDENYECIVIGSDNYTTTSGNVLAPWGSDKETCQAAILACSYDYCWCYVRNKSNPDANITPSEVWLNGEIRTYVDEKIASGKKRYVNYEDFELQIDTAVADCQSTSLNLQDSQIFEGDKGRIYLPKSYSANGKPTRLIIHCHGASQNYNNGSIFPTSSSFVTIDYLIAKGYAVLDINGMPGEHNFFATTSGNPVAYRSYIKAYEWAVKNYNLYKEIFVIGISAGSIPALQISNITTVPILAAVTYCGIMDFSRAWMLLGGYHPNSQGPAIKAYLADKYGFVGERPIFGNVDPCSDEEWKYIVDNVIQFEGWNTFMMGIKSTITREEYREIVSVVYGSDVPVWIPSDYSFGSVQQMLLAFKIPQRGNLSSYQTALAQEKKLYDTCSIYRKVPLKMFHAVNDDTAPYRYSQYYYEMCKRGGSVVEFRTFSSGGHSPIGSSQSVVIDGVTINTNTLSLEVMDWLQRFETL